MKRSAETLKLLALSLVFGVPIGYWLSSQGASHPSATYAQQVVESQQARGVLDRSASVANADGLSKVFRDVSKSVKPSVVIIKNVVVGSVRSKGKLRGIPPEFEQFFGGQLDGFELNGNGDSSPTSRTENGLGSGVIVREDGYILTNNHVVAGASVLEVVLSDDRKLEAKVIGTDERTDLAVLKIDASGLVAAPLGNSSNMEVGDWVIAIGSPFGLAQSVTAGIVSATNRNDQGITLYDSFIQTDAAINPGNSGGPLLNLRGEVIGINTAIASRSGGYNGIGFAVPSNTAQRVLDDLISKGRVTRGVIGIKPVTLTPRMAEKLALPADTKGAVVETITKNLPADKAGLKQWDIVTAINGIAIASESAMRRTIGETKPGTQVKLTYIRNGKTFDVPVVIEELDEKALMASSQETMEVLGMTVGSISEEVMEEFGLELGEGVEVKRVNRRSPLASLIPPGVVILSINGKKVGTPAELAEGVEAAKKSGGFKLVVRDSEADKVVQFRMQ